MVFGVTGREEKGGEGDDGGGDVKAKAEEWCE